MTLPIKLLISILSVIALFDIWYLASRDFTLLFKLTSVASILLAIIFIHTSKRTIPDYLILALAVLAVLFGFISNKDYGSLIILPLFSYFIGWLIKYVGQFFLGDKQLSNEDLRLFLVAGFFMDLNTIASFFVCVALLSIVFAILMKRLNLETPYTTAICISLFANFAHNIDILKSF